ncbi:MAG: sensor histidine kinase [Elusimicrobia bacterium]|nr:sensor histidine kinase [Candidatus Liberimonas magnetica]
MSLRYKIIFLFILAIVLPALLLSIILTSISKKALKNSIFYQQEETLNRLSDRLTSQINHNQQLLFVHKNIGRMPKAEQLLTAKEIFAQSEDFTEIALLDKNAREQWKLTRSGPVKNLAKRTTKPEFLEAYKGFEYISPVYISGQRSPYLILSIPLSPASSVLTAKLDLEKMWQWIKEIKVGQTGQAFVVDLKGNLIAHRDPERVWMHSDFSNLPIVKDFISYKQINSENWPEYKDEKGETVVSLYRPLAKFGWAVIIQIPAREVYLPVKRMYQSILFWTFVWTSIFLVVGYRFVKRIIDPLELLKSEAGKISQGKLDIKLDIKTGDEIQELAGSFEKMALSLKELEELRQDLISMIIHDLKSPLSGIMGGLDYLGSGLLGELTPEQKRIVEISNKSGQNLLIMIQNLLDIAKMEEGKLELRKEKFDIAKILLERFNQFEPLVKSENKTISADIGKDIPVIEIDGALIERVLNNLISNALHHTLKEGKIVLGLKNLDKFVEISVTDNGSGIPEEYKDKIFEKFVQIERKRVHLRTGAGLGLTFCKMAVEAHNGKIRVESEPGKGSSFILSLPSPT